MDENPPQNPSADLPPHEPAPTSRSSIRTLQSDVAHSVHDNNMSITSIALAQQEKNANLPFVADEEKHFWSAWSIGSIVLIIVGVCILVGTVGYLVIKNVGVPFMTPAPMAQTLVPVERQESVDTTRTTRVDFLNSIDTFINANYSSPVALEAFILTETVGTSTIATPITLERFFDRVGTRAPGRLIRSLTPDITFGRAGGTPFLVAQTNSYETAFAGLLEWEPFMAEDLSFIAGKLPKPIIPEPVVATSTATTSPNATTSATSTTTASTTPIVAVPPPPPAPVWKDIVVKNKDVRALIAHDGTMLLLYAFTNKNTLVITRTKEAFLLIVAAMNAPVFGN